MSEAFIGTDELSDDRADECERHCYLEPGEYRAQGLREADPAEELKTAKAEDASQVVHVRIDGAEASERIDHDREERNQHDGDDLGRDAESERHNEQRGNSDLGQGLQP